MLKTTRIIPRLLFCRRRFESTMVMRSIPESEEALDRNTCLTYLANGVRVVTEQKNSPLMCMSLYVTVGSRYEDKAEYGMTHAIEHLAFKGCRTINKSLLEDTVSHMGLKLSAKTERDYQAFTLVGPTQCLEFAVDFLYRIMSELLVTTGDVHRAIDTMLNELEEYEQNHEAVVFDYLHSTAFQGTPLGRAVMGSSSTLKGLTMISLVPFLKKHYRPCRLFLVACGGVCHQDVLKLATGSFGSLRDGGPVKVERCPCRYTSSEVRYRNDYIHHTYLTVGVEAPGLGSPDFIVMYVMNCLMGSWHKTQGKPDMQSFHTASAVATHDLCESYRSFYLPYSDVGLFGVFAVADKMELDELVANVQHAWMCMVHTCFEAEVKKAVNIAKLRIARKYDGVVNPVHELGSLLARGFVRKSLNDMFAALDCVAFTDIRRVASKYLAGQGPVVAAVGPTEVLPEFNRIASGMYWLKI